jgi:hypothetical protein
MLSASVLSSVLSAQAHVGNRSDVGRDRFIAPLG